MAQTERRLSSTARDRGLETDGCGCTCDVHSPNDRRYENMIFLSGYTDYKVGEKQKHGKEHRSKCYGVFNFLSGSRHEYFDFNNLWILFLAASCHGCVWRLCACRRRVRRSYQCCRPGLPVQVKTSGFAAASSISMPLPSTRLCRPGLACTRDAASVVQATAQWRGASFRSSEAAAPRFAIASADAPRSPKSWLKQSPCS